MYKLIIILSLFVGIIGCEHTRTESFTKEIQATVIKVEQNEEGFWSSCTTGLNYTTVLQLEDSTIVSICGWVGDDGAVITGYWSSGYTNSNSNGFSLQGPTK